ncbi:MAG TPA: NUDIX domain-containing protein [Flavobacteriales bacterium]|nr:NUDIX domain-containing protein [Flavobacteriales bacterium]
MLTLRAYGLLLNDPRTHVLVADELIRGQRITKFPGGGLEFGEGLKECVVREIREEIGIEALDVQHFYTTDFFQQSAFHSKPMQVVSVYFTFRVSDAAAIPVVDDAFTGINGPGDQEVFRWAPLTLDAEAAVSLPIDRLVWRMLQVGR